MKFQKHNCMTLCWYLNITLLQVENCIFVCVWVVGDMIQQVLRLMAVVREYIGECCNPKITMFVCVPVVYFVVLFFIVHSNYNQYILSKSAQVIRTGQIFLILHNVSQWSKQLCSLGFFFMICTKHCVLV
jgi:hypothetical protein